MATIYVATTGNDTTGDGSSGNPYASVAKGVSVATAGDTVTLADGTYTENNTGGCLYLTSAFANYVTIQSTSLDASKVTIRGTSGAYSSIELAGTAAYFKFRYVTLTNNAAGSHYAVDITKGTYIYFDHCSFSIVGGSSTYIGLYLTNSTGNISNVTVHNCTFTASGMLGQGGTAVGFKIAANASYASSNVTIENSTVFPASSLTPEAQYGIQVTSAANGLAQTGLVVTGNTVSGYLAAMSLYGCTGVAISGNEFMSTGPNYGVQFGENSVSTAYPITGAFSGNVIRTSDSTASHALLVGYGCTSLTIGGPNAADANLIYGGAYGIVMKNCDGPTVQNNVIVGGAIHVLLLKSAKNVTITNNVLVGTVNGSFLLSVYVDPASGIHFSGINFSSNRMISAGQCSVYNFISASDDGGHTVGGNVFQLVGSGAYGTIGASSNIATLATARTAWTAAGVTTGDANSWDATSFPVAAANVRSTIDRGDGTMGMIVVPAATDVRYGVSVDAATGSCYVPSAAQTLLGVSVDATTGTVRQPAVGSVAAGVLYGPDDSLEGTAVLTSEDVTAATLDLSDGVEIGKTVRQTLRIMAAVLAGKTSGAGSGVEEFTGIDGVTQRVEVDVDGQGNRTDVTYTA